MATFILLNRSASQTIRSGTINSAVTTTNSLSQPLDQLSSEQIARQAAQMTSLPELAMVQNQADSAAILASIIPNDSTILAKPQVVSTAQKSRHDIVTYVSQDGDTASGLAQKFGVSANSIKLSNGLSSDKIKAGTSLLIPPGEGIVYQVKTGDTVDSVVNRYQANKDTFISVNDAEGNNLPVGESVWIPNAIQPLILTTRTLTGGGGNFFSLPSTGTHKLGSCKIAPAFDGYPCGWCTWWAAYRRTQIGHPVPGSLGNAITWMRGLPWTNKPAAGTVIAFNPRNHVGYVESVDDEGNVNISEMNANGWDTVDYRTIPADQAGSYYYLY